MWNKYHRHCVGIRDTEYLYIRISNIGQTALVESISVQDANMHTHLDNQP